MAEESDQPELMGQVAGIIAMMSAIVKTLPPTARGRLERHIHAEFESLLAAMAATSEPDARCDLQRVEWMRDLFLKRIEESKSRKPHRRISGRKADSVRKPVAQDQPPVAEHQAPKDVDFEL